MRAWILQNKRVLLWVLRIAIPTVILSIHWAMGIPFWNSLILLFWYIFIPLIIFLFCINSLLFWALGLLLYPLVIPILKLYGLREPDTVQKQHDVPAFRPEKDLSNLVGLNGKTITPMRPAGKVMIDDTVYDAISEGFHIDKDSEVKIITCKGSELKVRSV